MKLFIATNWDNDLISRINTESVEEVYGKLASDFVGGSRHSYRLPHITKRQARTHIQQIHKRGMKFNYVLNAPCLDNKELTIPGQRELHRLLDWLVDIKVDSVTVTLPYLMQLIKRQYPQFKVYVSTVAGVDTIRRAKYWENIGADAITLDVIEVNRNFQMLKRIRDKVKCELQVIANVPCVYECGAAKVHYTCISHASQLTHPSRGFIVDYYLLRCLRNKIADPTLMIQTVWIRPEDVHYYEEIGIDRIKFGGRGWLTDALLRVVDAYTNQYYEGNLMDLMYPRAGKTIFTKSKISRIYRGLKYFFRPFSANIFKLRKIEGLSSGGLPFYIDNRALDGFLEHFLKEDCSLKSCKDCGYCKEVAARAVKVDVECQRKLLSRYDKFLEELISSKMFKYF